MSKTFYIKLTDIDVDGCGTNIDTLLKITTDKPSFPINEINNVIDETKENNNEWTTDDIIEAVEECLKQNGYNVEGTTPTYEFEF